MLFCPTVALAALASLVSHTLAVPIVPVHPGGASSIIITKKNTVNATAPAPKGPLPEPNANAKLPLAFVNNINGGSVNAYVTGLDTSGRLVMLQPNGQFYYPTADCSTGVPQPITGNVRIPLGGYGSTSDITLPDYVSSGRIWFAVGTLNFYTVCSGTGLPSLVEPSSANPSDPNANTNWGFVEFTNNGGGLYADISYVDFVGLPLGIEMVAGDGSTQSALGLKANAVSSICSSLSSQGASDGQPWGNLCRKSLRNHFVHLKAGSNGQAIRAIAPQDYISGNPSAFSSYWTNYINQVFSHYGSNTLTIDTQGSAGNVACTVQNGQFQCAGDNRGYAKPSAGDIFGCNGGPFAIQGGDNGVHSAVVPRLCAAFDRSTLLASNGNNQPDGPAVSQYYTTNPTNYFSKFVHALEVDGKGYAFPYDDVNADGATNQAGVVTDGNPQKLTTIVGGPRN